MSNKFLTHMFSSARTALANPSQIELVQWIGTGPSVRARARLALMAAFLVSVPTLFIGVIRSDSVATYLKTIGSYDAFWRQISNARVGTEVVRAGLWQFVTQPEIANGRALLRDAEILSSLVAGLTTTKPPDFDMSSVSQLYELNRRVSESILQVIYREKQFELLSTAQAITNSTLALKSLAEDLQELESRVGTWIETERRSAIGALSKVGRDQLFLFLVLLFAIPIFVGFAPGWLVAPLTRLKSIEHRIEEGRIRELGVSGKDEISRLARAIKNALVWREELDQRKSAKIFEIRNVLRAVISHVAEPVLIIDRAGRVNYANQAAAQLVDVEAHHLEGRALHEHIFAPELERALKKALEGDVVDTGLNVNIELSDGRSESMKAQLSAVHERLGGVSRVVVVLTRSEEIPS